MELSDTVRKILSNYGSDNPGTRGKLSRFLMQGRLGGTGKMIILPVDQGVEHGPPELGQSVDRGVGDSQARPAVARQVDGDHR